MMLVFSTTLEPNAGWWDTPKHNLTKVEFTTIASDATRVAALLSSELDMVYPVPVQDLKRVNDNATTSALTGPELRTIFLGMDQVRDELLESSVKGKNPFKDVRVRKAFYQAINIEAIKKKVMRDLATPSAIMISPNLFSKAGDFARFPYDVAASKALLADAGYPDGFEVGMDCPNDRYVNDEAICQAVTAMLAKAGIKVNLNAQPKSKYLPKCWPPTVLKHHSSCSAGPPVRSILERDFKLAWLSRCKRQGQPVQSWWLLQPES